MYCGHEYTAANLRFALTVEPSNRAALDYRDRVARLRAADAPSLPSPHVAGECASIRFCAATAPAVRAAAEAHAGRALPEPAEVFGVLRAWKDQFR